MTDSDAESGAMNCQSPVPDPLARVRRRIQSALASVERRIEESQDGSDLASLRETRATLTRDLQATERTQSRIRSWPDRSPAEVAELLVRSLTRLTRHNLRGHEREQVRTIAAIAALVMVRHSVEEDRQRLARRAWGRGSTKPVTEDLSAGGSREVP